MTDVLPPSAAYSAGRKLVNNQTAMQLPSEAWMWLITIAPGLRVDHLMRPAVQGAAGIAFERTPASGRMANGSKEALDVRAVPLDAIGKTKRRCLVAVYWVSALPTRCKGLPFIIKCRGAAQCIWAPPCRQEMAGGSQQSRFNPVRLNV